MSQGLRWMSTTICIPDCPTTLTLDVDDTLKLYHNHNALIWSQGATGPLDYLQVTNGGYIQLVRTDGTVAWEDNDSIGWSTMG